MRTPRLRTGLSAVLGTILLLAVNSGAFAQTPTTASANAPVLDEDLELDPSEPDFTVITLPTNLRLPKHKLGFFLTHRFARQLGRGDFGDLASDFFGFDGGAQIGLGLRFGLFPGTQLGIYRTSDRTIQLYAQSEIVSQRKHAIGVSLHASVEGTENFGLSDPRVPGLDAIYSPAFSLVVSRKLGTRGAAYLVPRWVGNTPLSEDQPGDDSTFLLGVGLRVRLYGSTYVTGEVLPRLAGYKGALCSGTVCIGDTDTLVTFAIEKQVGGHAFSINFSNGTGTTPRQTVTDQTRENDWYIGFNLSRKFY
jgi:Membrane bound beta barrel domain (DUF5777)